MAVQLVTKRISDWALIELIVQQYETNTCLCAMMNQEDKSTFIQEIVEGTEDTIIDKVLEIIEEKVNKEFGIRLDTDYPNVLKLTN